MNHKPTRLPLCVLAEIAHCIAQQLHDFHVACVAVNHYAPACKMLLVGHMDFCRDFVLHLMYITHMKAFAV